MIQHDWTNRRFEQFVRRFDDGTVNDADAFFSQPDVDIDPLSPDALRRIPGGRASVRDLYVRIEKYVLVASTLKASRSSARLDLQSQFGKYEIDEQLGSGGMGEVYRARDVELDRYVALKLPRWIATDKDIRRLKREALAVAKLRHPAIVPVFEFGEIDMTPYIAMELVTGESLQSDMAEPRNGERPESEKPQRAVALFIQALEGLSHAHEHGVIHRDLKPSNIMLQDGHPRLVDFGIAAISEEPLSESVERQGTLAYTAPELVNIPSRGTVQSDIYAMGVCLYEYLTRQRPFEASSVAALANEICSGEYKPAHRFGHVPRDLSAIIDTALALELENRYQNADAFRNDLERFRDGRAVRARPQSAWTVWARRARRRPVSTVAILIALITLPVLSVMSVAWQRDRAEADLKEAREILKDALFMEYRDIPRSASHPFTRMERAKAVEQLERALELDPELSDARLFAAVLSAEIDQYDRSRQHLDRLGDEHPRISGWVRAHLEGSESTFVYPPSPDWDNPPKSVVERFYLGRAAQRLSKQDDLALKLLLPLVGDPLYGPPAAFTLGVCFSTRKPPNHRMAAIYFAYARYPSKQDRLLLSNQLVTLLRSLSSEPSMRAEFREALVEEAHGLARELTTLYPEYHRGWTTYAEGVLEHLGDTEKAREIAEAGLEQHPDNAELLSTIGQSFLDEAMRVEPPDADLLIEAHERLLEAHDKGPRNAITALRLAVAARGLGEMGEVREWVEMYKTLDPADARLPQRERLLHSLLQDDG